jgi:hypothetical protein
VSAPIFRRFGCRLPPDGGVAGRERESPPAGHRRREDSAASRSAHQTPFANRQTGRGVPSAGRRKNKTGPCSDREFKPILNLRILPSAPALRAAGRPGGRAAGRPQRLTSREVAVGQQATGRVVDCFAKPASCRVQSASDLRWLRTFQGPVPGGSYASASPRCRPPAAPGRGRR